MCTLLGSIDYLRLGTLEVSPSAIPPLFTSPAPPNMSPNQLQTDQLLAIRVHVTLCVVCCSVWCRSGVGLVSAWCWPHCCDRGITVSCFMFVKNRFVSASAGLCST